LADPAVTLLDPAAGTLTFPVEAMRLAVDEYTQKYGQGNKNGFIKNQLLKNYYAFELMMAPYAIGHLKMSFLLEELGCPLSNEERFQLYLTNTLTMEEIYLNDVPGLSSLGEESQAASQVKKKNILVILGNPPYSGMSANQNDWTEQLLKTDMDGAQSYYVVDGKPLGEKNPKWLQDDYVKFIRFAQWKVQRAGEGVVGMITNHGYLDNPTFRGMRQSLMKTFNEIFVLNLHGNSLKKETAPDGSIDKNVFDIRTGVAIILMVKRKGASGCSVQQTDLFGTRETKYDWLDANSLESTTFVDTHASTPWYFFVKPGIQDLSVYQEWLGINEIFPKNSAGIVTGRDELTIRGNENELWNTIQIFIKLEPEQARITFDLGPDTRDWKITLAQKDLRDSGPDRKNIASIHYRPFDIRKTYFTGRSRGFQCMPRGDVMRHMLLGENLGLITVRRVPSNKEPLYFFISDSIISNGVIRSDNQSIDSLFPLYLYSTDSQHNLFSGARTPNLKPELVEKLASKYGYNPEPEEILAYIYGVFYSNIYRQKYAEALRVDFPRVPFTGDPVVFKNMAQLGQRLIELHLLKGAELNPPLARYQGSSENNTIEKVAYYAASQRIYINEQKYFEGISSEVWQYQIGGYQVLNKYLKDRKGRVMDGPVHYVRITTALAKTIEIQKEIDTVYPDVEKGLLTF
jgi:predicted helicase